MPNTTYTYQYEEDIYEEIYDSYTGEIYQYPAGTITQTGTAHAAIQSVLKTEDNTILALSSSKIFYTKDNTTWKILDIPTELQDDGISGGSYPVNFRTSQDDWVYYKNRIVSIDYNKNNVVFTGFPLPNYGILPTPTSQHDTIYLGKT